MEIENKDKDNGVSKDHKQSKIRKKNQSPFSGSMMLLQKNILAKSNVLYKGRQEAAFPLKISIVSFEN